MNKVILFIATSLDGFIADENGGVDWLPQPKGDDDLQSVGYKELMCRIGTILMGYCTYKQVLGFGDWAWTDKHTYVFTRKEIQSEKPYISITDKSPAQFMSQFRDLRSERDLWLLGGAQLVQSFARVDLIDEIILTIVPSTLGSGIPLGLNLEEFEFVSEKPIINGMVQKSYLRKTL